MELMAVCHDTGTGAFRMNRNWAPILDSSEVEMRIELDQPRCEGHGLCEEVAPDLVHLDDEGELIIDIAEIEVGSDEEHHAQEAVRICPVTALSLK